MSTRPRQDFIGKYTHEEIWEFAQRLARPKLFDPVGFSVAAAMIEQLLAESDMPNTPAHGSDGRSIP